MKEGKKFMQKYIKILKIIIASIVLLGFAPNTYAGILDKWSDLKGWTLVETGFVQSFDCPYSYDFENLNACDAWPTNLKTFGTMQFGNEDKFCFKGTNFGSLLGTDEVLVFMKKKKIRIVKVGNFSKSFEYKDIQIFTCPARY